eukprot:6402005-Pyramimonas_sp.AAC.1
MMWILRAMMWILRATMWILRAMMWILRATMCHGCRRARRERKELSSRSRTIRLSNRSIVNSFLEGYYGLLGLEASDCRVTFVSHPQAGL